MKRAFAVTLGISSLLWASSVLPCGGMFGPNATVSPSQTLVVAHKANTETYVFRPHFCGESTQFGLILPLPSTLTKSPALTDPGLFDELNRISAPDVVKTKVCKGRESDLAGAQPPGASNDRDGVDVVDKGQVGIFDWALVKADTKASFTEWLDANGFPHAPDADAQFSHYVDEGWYFVAFKVTASDSAPPTGKRLCGDFGPIELAFHADKPVVPTRIAAVSAGGRSPAWRIYGLSAPGQQLSSTSGEYPAMLSYSDELGESTLAGAPQLSKLAARGDRLVRLEVGFSFSGIANAKDLTLGTAPPQKFRSTSTEIEYFDCPSTEPSRSTPLPAEPSTSSTASSSSSGGGCVVSRESRGSDFALVALGVSLALVVSRRRRLA